MAALEIRELLMERQRERHVPVGSVGAIANGVSVTADALDICHAPIDANTPSTARSRSLSCLLSRLSPR